MKKLLLVDDDKAIREMLTETLTKEGYLVNTAEDGDEALAILQRNKIDIMIIDMVMPRRNGIETIMKLRRKRENIPFIAMSGGDHIKPEKYLDIARKLGAYCTLCKPFRRQELLDALSGC